MGNLIQENTRWPSVCFMKEEVVVNDPKNLIVLIFAQDMKVLG